MKVQFGRFQTLTTWDVLPAGVFLFIGIMGTRAVTRAADTDTTGLIIAFACIVVAAGALLVRNWWPLAVLAVVTAAVVVYSLANLPNGPIYLSHLLATFAVATTTSRTRSLLWALAAAVSVGAAAYIGSGFERELLGFPVLYFGWSVAIVFLGSSIHNRRRYMESVQLRAQQAEETREEEAMRRVAEERVRIARDLHDVIAHGLATITVQAGAGVHVIDRDPASAKEALIAIRDTSKQALQDLRATLDMLRQDGEAAPHQPTPGLRDLPTLVQSVERTGLTVHTAIEGEVYELPQAVDVAAYRIVQESLTNVVRHAQATEASLRVGYGAEFIELEVTDNGAGALQAPRAGGHGIMGMTERATSVGGTLTAQPRAGGGFRVSARLPRGLQA